MGISLYLGILIALAVLIYNCYPWNKGYTGFEIIKDYYHKKDSLKSIDISWQYSLSPSVENFALIDMSQRKFINELKPEKCYLFQSFYYDTNQVQQYIDKFIIYFKNGRPFSSDNKTNLIKGGDDFFYIDRPIKQAAVVIEIYKEGSPRLAFRQSDIGIINRSGENYYGQLGIYRCELKKTDCFNGFNIRKAFWIYNIFPNCAECSGE
ncbi:MAG: hypothetical protein WDO19_24810 [Bacteroidota bacterium]